MMLISANTKFIHDPTCQIASWVDETNCQIYVVKLAKYD